MPPGASVQPTAANRSANRRFPSSPLTPSGTTGNTQVERSDTPRMDPNENRCARQWEAGGARIPAAHGISSSIGRRMEGGDDRTTRNWTSAGADLPLGQAHLVLRRRCFHASG